MVKVQGSYWMEEEDKMFLDDLGLGATEILRNFVESLRMGQNPELLLAKKEEYLMKIAGIDAQISLAKERSTLRDVATMNIVSVKQEILDRFNRFNRGDYQMEENVVWLNNPSLVSMWKSAGFSDVFEVLAWIDNGGDK